MLVTGGTNNSRLIELKKYAIGVSFDNQYFGNGSWTNNGVDFTNSTEDVEVVYYISGIKFIDYITSGLTETTTYTKFVFTPEGTDNPNFINEQYIKNPSKSKLVDNPKINNDVFIVRDNLSAFNYNYKLEYVRNLLDLTTYAGGKYFNIINNA